MREPIENEYFNWLCAKVVERNYRGYNKLLEILYRTEFIWVVHADKHRVEDGLELREDFLRQTHSERDISWESLPCSVFELFIAFAIRASFYTDMPIKDWFWKIITNLQLDQFRNVSHSDIPIIEEILTVFMFRTYDPHGYGGMFPIPSTRNDQRDIEIWYQFCEYLEDKGLV